MRVVPYFECMTPSNCLNCNHALQPADKFCANCGQTSHTHRLSLGHLGHEILHFFTHADKGIFLLIKDLMISPGRVTREYVAGKRKTYFSPLSFFFIVVGIFLFAFTTLRPMQADDSTSQAYISGLKKLPPTPANLKKVDIAERQYKAMGFMSKYANFVNMVFTPLVALVFYLFYLKGRYNYTEHLVANLYAAGINALFFSLIIAPLTLLITKGTLLHFLLIMVFLLWETLYRTFLYYGFMQRKGFVGFMYPLFVSILVTYGWYKLSTGMIGWYIRTGFH